MAQFDIPERELLDRILAYCSKHGVSKSSFGILAANDTAFVFTLEQGRELRRGLRGRVEATLQKAPQKAAS